MCIVHMNSLALKRAGFGQKKNNNNKPTQTHRTSLISSIIKLYICIFVCVLTHHKSKILFPEESMSMSMSMVVYCVTGGGGIGAERAVVVGNWVRISAIKPEGFSISLSSPEKQQQQ